MSDFFSCLDYWASRYQGLLVGVVALTIAFQQLGIARRQSQISQEQHRMAQVQKNTENAIATIAIDRFTGALHLAVSRMISFNYHGSGAAGPNPDMRVNWHWNPKALCFFDDLEPPSELESLAIKAFAKEAPELVQLASSMEEVKALSDEFAREPWEYDPSPGDMYPREMSPRDLDMARKTDTALNRLYSLVNQLSHVFPNSRERAGAILTRTP